MPITIKTANLKYKNAQGEYVGVNSISDKTTEEQLAEINSAGSTKVTEINNAGSTRVTEINNAGSTRVTEINNAGATKIADIESKGQEVLESIPSDYSDLANQVSDLNSAIKLLDEMIMDTVQAISFDQSGNVSQITHSRNGTVVRTDAFTFGTNTITEVRTLAATGESVTIVTNTTTLETTVTYAAA